MPDTDVDQHKNRMLAVNAMKDAQILADQGSYWVISLSALRLTFSFLSVIPFPFTGTDILSSMLIICM